MSQDFPWPAKGDTAFTADQDSDLAFRLREIFPYYPYRAEAFKHGADVLLDAHLAGDNKWLRNEVFFPIAYLYRHAMELYLKDIIRSGVGLGIVTTGEVPTRSHNLSHLWSLEKRAIVTIWSDGEEVTTVEQVVKEFFAVDPKGEIFRYDSDTSLLPQLRGMPEAIDPIRLRQTMERTFSFLNSTSSGASHTLDEMQRGAG